MPIRRSEGSGEVGGVGLPSGLRVTAWDAQPSRKIQCVGPKGDTDASLGINSGGAGMKLNPTLGKLGVPSMRRIPLVEATSSKHEFGSESDVWRRRSFKGRKKGKQCEEQISFTLIQELREGEEVKVESSFKMRLRLKYQTEMVPNTLGG